MPKSAWVAALAEVNGEAQSLAERLSAPRTPPVPPVEKARMSVLAVIDRYGSLTRRDIAARVDYPWEPMNYVLRKLSKAGQIVVVGHGPGSRYYSATASVVPFRQRVSA
jgi:hypothetical protein